MNAFTKLVLVSAVAAAPLSGMAMQSLDDEALSGVTGQDGIRLTMDMNQTLNLLVEDTTGLGNSTAMGKEDFVNGGGILIRGMELAGKTVVDVDAGGDGQGGGVLNLGISVTDLSLKTGDIYVVDTGREIGSTHLAADDSVAALASSTPSEGKILDSMGVNIAKLGLEVQLGSAASNLISITDGQIGDVELTDFGLNDATGGGKLGVEKITLSGLDISGTTVSIIGSGGTEAEGLRIALGGQIGNVTLDNVSLGGSAAAASTASLGNIYVNGLTLAGSSLTISGK